MRRIWLVGLLGSCIFFGCGAHHTIDGGLADLYLGTLDDKHFAWCTLDVDQCRKDFIEWKQTQRGRTLVREYEKEQTGQAYNTQEYADVIETGEVSVIPTKYGPNLDTQNGSSATPTHTNTVP